MSNLLASGRHWTRFRDREPESVLMAASGSTRPLSDGYLASAGKRFAAEVRGNSSGIPSCLYQATSPGLGGSLADSQAKTWQQLQPSGACEACSQEELAEFIRRVESDPARIGQPG